jgi:hypothetical protein
MRAESSASAMEELSAALDGSKTVATGTVQRVPVR